MIRYHDDSVRYFTVFEGKRIQTFPDDYQITGAWTEAMRQIGNAVPVMLGNKIGAALLQKLNSETRPKAQRSIKATPAILVGV